MQWKLWSGMGEKAQGHMASSSIWLRWFHIQLRAARVNERNYCQKEAFPKKAVTLLLSSYVLLPFFFPCLLFTLNPGPCFSNVKLKNFIKREEKRAEHLLYSSMKKMQNITKGIYTTSRSLASWKLVLEKFWISFNLLADINFTAQVLCRSNDQNHLLFGLLLFGTTVITVYIILHTHS